MNWSVLTQPTTAGLLVVFALLLVIQYLVNLYRNEEENGVLDPVEWRPLQLIDKKVVSHNTRRFRFGFPRQDQLLGLPVGKHVIMKGSTAQGDVIKPYTPVTDVKQRGFVDFVIKVYPEGRMSQHLDKMEPGDELLFKGPRGAFEYKANSQKAIGMLAGGTGVTPMWQVAYHILKNPKDRTKVSLIFGNLTEEDILIKPELDALAREHPEDFHLYYVVNEASPGWTGGKGFITVDTIKSHLPPPQEGTLTLRCGPPGMNKAMEGHLNSLGYTESMQFQF